MRQGRIEPWESSQQARDWASLLYLDDLVTIDVEVHAVLFPVADSS
jgi:hypothetical protein